MESCKYPTVCSLTGITLCIDQSSEGFRFEKQKLHPCFRDVNETLTRRLPFLNFSSQAKTYKAYRKTYRHTNTKKGSSGQLNCCVIQLPHYVHFLFHCLAHSLASPVPFGFCSEIKSPVIRWRCCQLKLSLWQRQAARQEGMHPGTHAHTCRHTERHKTQGKAGTYLDWLN